MMFVIWIFVEKYFMNSTSFRKHQQIHGEKHYICLYPGCGKRFTQNSNLNAHEKTHKELLIKEANNNIDGLNNKPIIDIRDFIKDGNKNQEMNSSNFFNINFSNFNMQNNHFNKFNNYNQMNNNF